MASSPLHQFLIQPLIPLKIGSLDLSFSNASLFMFLTVGVAVLFFYYATRSPNLVPKRLQCAGEMAYNLVAQIVKDTNGDLGKKYFPFVFSLFIFIFMGNMLGMIPYGFTFTSQIIVTFSLAMMVFLLTTLVGIIKHRSRFLTLFLPQGAPLYMAPLLIPIEILSYFSRPISLSVRLFANMMAGHTMLKVFGGFTFALGIFGVAPLAINIALTAFEILVAFLQAYVFTVLTCLYLHDALYLH